MQSELKLSMDEARFISLVAQRLDGVPAPGRKKPSKAEILEMIRTLGCVQLDTISVVARSHETVLWSRLGPFDPALIRELFYPDRALLEYWVHAAAIAPVEMFPYFLRTMQRHHHDAIENAEEWQGKNRQFVLGVLNQIAANGPSASRDFERAEGPRPDPWTWYGGKPAKQALDALWTAGELIIQERVGFQRIYELTDRAFPGWRAQTPPSIEAQQRFFITKALKAMGVATSRWTADYFRGGRSHVGAANTLLELRALEADGLAIPATIGDLSDEAWLDRDMLPVLEAFRHGEIRPTRTTLLSPFDSLIWNRERALALFDFDYRIECYTPAEKRIYGYYSLAMLHRGKLVGRLDPAYKRKEKRLILNAVHLEQGVRPTRALARSIVKALASYVEFMGGGAIEATGGGNRELMEMLNRETAGGAA
jgi:uncharacterized protein YcaQ